MIKVTVAQITSDPACFQENFTKISEAISKAQTEGSNLVVFPELALCGYVHLDLVHRQSFLDDNQEYLKKLIPLTKNIAVIVGFVEEDFKNKTTSGRKRFFNSAAVIENCQLKTIIRKQLLPTYDIFFEERYFQPGELSTIFEVSGLKVGLGICEDLWDQDYNKKIYQKLINDGAELLVNISASPFEPNKLNRRIELVKQLGRIPFVYTNLVGSFDGYDGEIVFDGRSFLTNSDGKLIYLAPACKESTFTIDLSKCSEIIPDSLEISEIYQALVLGIKEYFRRTKFRKAYLGLSGGIDSAVVASLLVKALGSENVVGVTMPSKITSPETKSDAHELAKNLGIKIYERSIKELYQTWLDGFIASNGEEPKSLTKQNIQARFRGMILMEYTNQDTDSLLITTGNKTELALGYCTIYGDMCGALAPIADLNKIRVYELASYINKTANFAVIPLSTITRIPSAELEIDQKDVDNLPADYDTLAPLVDHLVEEDLSIHDLSQKYDPLVVEKSARLIKINEFKRRQAPPGIRVTSKAFGIGRRIPITHGSH